jgi:hypothetical protein
MNKLLPILLVVVLSGCSGNPLEKCADDGIKYEFKFFRDKGYILTDSEYQSCREYGNRNSGCHNKIFRDRYLNQSLDIKLKDYRYTTAFKKCEIEKTKYPETFKSKWK